MDLNAVMNASATDEEDEHLAQQQDEETAEALRSIRQSRTFDDHESDADEEEDCGLEGEQQQRLRAGAAASSVRDGSKPSASDPHARGSERRGASQPVSSVAFHSSEQKRNGDDGKNAHKKRKRGAFAALSRSRSNSSSTQPSKDEKPDSSAAVKSEHESSSRTLRKLAGGSTGHAADHAADGHKLKHEASTSNIPAAFLATQAFSSPRDFFVSPSGSASAAVSMDADSSHVVCTLCEVLIGSRVYSLKRHLYRHHPQVFRVPSDEVDIVPSNATADSNAKLDMKLDDEAAVKLKHEAAATLTPSKKAAKRKPSSSSSYSSTDASRQSLDRMNDAFVAWLRGDVVPMKALESALFRQFLLEINPSFKIPAVVVQPRQPLLAIASPLLHETKSHAVRFMRGLCLQGNGQAPMLRTDLAVPTPSAGEALIKIVRAGICGTDLMMIDNYKPGFKGVIGHEFVGIVQQVGSSCGDADNKTDAKADAERAAWLGKRVVGEINIPCNGHECSTCNRAAASSTSPLGTREHNQQQQQQQQQRRQLLVKRRNHCPNRAALGIVGKDGVFAEFITLPLANLAVVPESVVDAHAVFAEPLAAACRILEQQTIQSHERVAVLGDGKLGLLVAEVLHAKGVAKEVTLVGKHREKLALMKHIVAHTLTLDDVTTQLAGHGEDAAAARFGFDVCVECTGTPTGMTMALQLLKRGGVLVMKSTCSIKKSPVDLQQVHAKRVRVIGSRCGPFDMAMALLRDKQVDVQKFIHGVYPLARADAALVHAAQRGALKIQLVIV